MSIIDILTVALIGIGAFFCLAGTVGLLRFPDTHSRLHALTKADNLGLGFIVAGLVFQADSIATAAKILLIWLVVLISSATSCYLLAAFAARQPLSKG